MNLHPELFRQRWLAACLAASIALMAGCAVNPVTGQHDLVLMSEQQEIATGRHGNEEVLKQFQVYDDPALQQYVSRLGQELARHSHRPNLPFHFTVLDSPMVNAFALPGGYVYISRGILAYLNSEAQLAGILGHEIGHVSARHGVRQQSQAAIVGILGAVATAATGNSEVADLSNTIGTAWLRGYGRQNELEADRLGAEYLARDGFDPHQMIEVIGILKSQEEFARQQARAEGRQPPSYHGVFATHPGNDQRLQEVVQAAAHYQGSNYRKPDSTAFLHLLDGVVFGNSEQQGILHGQRFYHHALDFTVEFPAGWQVQNQADRLLAVSADGRELLQLLPYTGNRPASPRELLQARFRNLAQGQPLTVGGQPAYTGITMLASPFGQRPGRVAAIYHGQYAFIAAAVAQRGSAEPAFLATVNSLRRLHPDEIRLAEAQHIELVTAHSGDTFETLARHSPLGRHATGQLRLLNGLYPNGEPRAGQLIKIVR